MVVLNKKKVKNKKKVGKRILIFIVLVLILGFFIKIIKGKTYKSYNTVFPTLTTYENDIDTTFYNVLNEKVYKAGGDGIAIFNASEGQKVAVGYEIASINLMEDVSNLRDELQKVKAALKNKDSNEEVSEKVNFDRDIQKDILNKNFQGATEKINALDMDATNTFSISDLKEYLGMSKEKLLSKRDSLDKEISKYNISYRAEFTGIVSYEIDGLEDYFSPDKFSKFTYDYLDKNFKVEKNNLKLKVKKDYPMFKLIDNFTYEVVAKIQKASLINNYKKGDNIKIKINNLDILNGKVLNIIRSQKNATILISLDDSIDNIYNKRIHEGKIIVDKTRGYIIPKSCLIQRNNLMGIYVQEIKGLVKFVPVDIIREEADKVFINRGNKQSLIEVADKTYKTLTINDAVVLSPRTVDESRILN